MLFLIQESNSRFLDLGCSRINTNKVNQTEETKFMSATCKWPRGEPDLVYDEFPWLMEKPAEGLSWYRCRGKCQQAGGAIRGQQGKYVLTRRSAREEF